jgi:hypothetical protein
VVGATYADLTVGSEGTGRIGRLSLAYEGGANDYTGRIIPNAAMAGDVDITLPSYTTTLIGAGANTFTGLQTFSGAATIKLGNVTWVPIGGDINAYITAATAGDTLILTSGTYTITSAINVSKQLNIVGQGNAGLYSVTETDVHGTRIYCVTDNITMFNITSSNVRLAHMSIYHAGAGTSVVGVGVANNLDGIVLTNLDVVMPSGAGTKAAFDILGSHTILRDIAFYIVSSNNPAYGVYVHNNSSSTLNAIIDCHTTSGTVSGGLTAGYPYYVYNDNDANTVTLNLFAAWGEAITGTANDVGAKASSTTTNNAKLNVYQSTLKGADYDIQQTGTNTVTVYGGVFVNNTTNGTITYGGTIAASAFTGTITNAANVAMLNESTDTTCFPAFVTTDTPGNVPLKTVSTLTFNSNTGALGATSFSGSASGLTSLPAANLLIASQAAGDTLYATSGTVWGRLAKGTAYQLLQMNSGATAPEWTSTQSGFS